MKKTVHVNKHMRNGKAVRGYTQQRDAWKQAAGAWGVTAASGLSTAALVTQLGLALISTLAIVLTVLLGALSVKLTEKATAPKRTMRAKTRPRTTASRSRTTATRSRSSAAGRRRR